MQENKYYRSLVSICGEDSAFWDVPMKEYTTMKVGGSADLMVQPESIDIARECITYLYDKKVPYIIMGNGSNLIFPDEGFSGVVLRIGPRLSDVKVTDDLIVADGGASLASVANRALEHSLTGLEFASGIPGSVGGAAYMNAGAYDGEMKQVVLKTLCINLEGRVISLEGDDHNFSYRHSRIQDEGLACMQVTLKLQKGNCQTIQAKMKDLNSRRRDKQPLNLPSAGSVFKRPPGCFAGKLIEDCGLRGFAIGGAQVSEKHCGFIVNTGKATSKDIIKLINHVRETVYEKTGVMLEPEVKIIRGT